VHGGKKAWIVLSAPSRTDSERRVAPIATRQVTAPVAVSVPAPAQAQPARPHPRLAAALAMLMAAAGALVLLSGARAFIAHPDGVPLVLMLIAALIGAIPLPAYGSRVSLGPLPIIAAAFLSGPLAAALVGCAAAIGAELRPHPHGWRCPYNAGAFTLAALVGGLAGHALPTARETEPLYLLSFGLIASGALYLANIVPVCCFGWALSGDSPLAIWRERFRWMLPQTLLLGPVGTGVAVAYRYAGLYELIAFALPVVAMHLAWRQYLAHTTRSVEDLRQKNADLIQLAARLQSANEQVLSTYRGTLEALVGALDARDNEVQGHSYRVSAYSQIMAEQLGVERGSIEWETIARGALLHDVGKIGIRDAVLRKPGALDDAEWVEMRTHAEIGFGILRDIDFLKPAAALVQAHHERYDGTGYPRGLKGEQIPLGARIFAVADTFDAITTDRPYRRALPPEAAVAEIRRCAGSQFDPDVVEVFLNLWTELWAIRPDAVHMVA